MKESISTLNVSKVLKKYYWPKIDVEGKDTKAIISEPVLDLLDHVAGSLKADLSKKDECSYGGSVLLFAVIDATNRKYSYDIEETNELYKEGKALANKIWEALASGMKKEEIKEQIIQSVWDVYSNQITDKKSEV